MTFLLQATTRIDEWHRLAEALHWLSAEVGHAPGLVSLRIFRDHGDDKRVTMLEEWESPEAFQESFEVYSAEKRAAFLSRLGLTAEDFERSLWSSTDLVLGPGAPA